MKFPVSKHMLFVEVVRNNSPCNNSAANLDTIQLRFLHRLPDQPKITSAIRVLENVPRAGCWTLYSQSRASEEGIIRWFNSLQVEFFSNPTDFSLHKSSSLMPSHRSVLRCPLLWSSSTCPRPRPWHPLLGLFSHCGSRFRRGRAWWWWWCRERSGWGLRGSQWAQSESNIAWPQRWWQTDR